MEHSDQAIKESNAAPIGTNYKLIVLNSSISRLGTSGFAVSILWFALIVTGSPVLAGFADGMGALPLLLSFAFGAYVDSLSSKKQLAVLASVIRAVSILSLFLALRFSNLFIETASIYFVAFVMGLTSDILNSTTASWTKQFLLDTQYKRGTSLMQSTTSLAQSVGYAVAGALILFGFNFTIYSFAIIFAISVIPLLLMRNETTIKVSGEKSLQSSLINGIRYIFGDKRLRAMIILTLIVNLAFGTVGIFFAVLVSDQFKLPAIYYTFLFLSLTLGLFFGAILGAKAKGKAGFYSMTIILAIGILLFLIGELRSVYPDYAVSFVMGLLIGIVNVVITTAVVKIVEQEMMGRVMGAVNTFAISLTFVSGAIGGVLIRLLTLHGAFFLVGALIAVSAALPLFFRDFYNLEV